jgi:polysaccharide export outer membrane protein
VLLACVPPDRADKEVVSMQLAVKMRNVKRICRLIGCAVAGLLSAGCSATGYSIADLAAEINATRDTARTVIVVGDSIRVSFPFKPEWDQSVRVRPDGFASFQLIDEVRVLGMSIAELDTLLTGKYRDKQGTKDLELTVDVPSAGGSGITTAGTEGGAGDSDARTIYVVGEVVNPGPVTLSGRTITLFGAISAAGGHKKATANLRNTILIRLLVSSNEMRSWRLDADIYQWGSLPPIYLQSRDIVFVPNTAIDEVNIWVDQYIRQMLPVPYLIPPP